MKTRADLDNDKEFLMRGCIVIALGLVTVLSAHSSRGAEPTRPDIVWHGSYAEARELAKSMGKPLLVQFR